MGGDVQQAQSLIGELLSKLNIMANDLGDVGDALHRQADRIFGTGPAEETNAPSNPSAASSPAGPSAVLLADAVARLGSKIARVRSGQDRMSVVG